MLEIGTAQYRASIDASIQALFFFTFIPPRLTAQEILLFALPCVCPSQDEKNVHRCLHAGPKRDPHQLAGAQTAHWANQVAVAAQSLSPAI